MNDKKMKHLYFWYGRSFTGLDRRFSHPQHPLKPKPNPEQGLKFLQFYKCWEKWGNCQSVSQFSSVTQSCPTLCYPMDCSMPGFPVHHQLLKLAQTHVHQVSDAIQPSHPLSPLLFRLQSLPASGSFPMSQFFITDSQSIGASASASVLPRNTQGWFLLGLTGLISFDLQGTLRSFLQHYSSKATVLQHSTFFMVQLSHPYMTTRKTTALTIRTFVSKVMSLLFNKLSKREDRDSAQSCLPLCNPTDCSLPGSCYRLPQARILEWVAISFSRGSSWPRDQSRISRIAGRFFTILVTREIQNTY